MKRPRKFLGYIVLLNGKPAKLATRESELGLGVPPGPAGRPRILWQEYGRRIIDRGQSPRVSVFRTKGEALRACAASIDAHRAAHLQTGINANEYAIVAFDGGA